MKNASLIYRSIYIILFVVILTLILRSFNLLFNFCKRAEKFMAPFLGYLEERWGYLVNRKRKKKTKKEISEIQDKRNHEIIQEPIILLDNTFCQFSPLRPAARNLSE